MVSSCIFNFVQIIALYSFCDANLLAAAASCLSEMTAVMSCWKVNSFDDVPCRKEIQDFVACAEKVVSHIQKSKVA